MRFEKLRKLAVVAVGATAVMALALPVTAGAGAYVKAWPTLSVAKALAPENRVDATGPFTVTVTCDYPMTESVDDGGPMVVTLVFGPDGTPQSASDPAWVNDGKTWSFTGRDLKNKQCLIVETEKANAVSVSYTCAFSNEVFEQLPDIDAEDYYDVEPGCAEAGPSATPAVVQFGSPWDGSCYEFDDEIQPRGGAQCQQEALVTVTNTLPDLKSEIVTQVPLQPNFPG